MNAATAATAAAAADVYVPYTKVCPKCKGEGVYTAASGRVLGQCFTCHGEGSVSTGRAEREAAPQVHAEALHAAFDKARESGLKRLKIRLGAVSIKPAPASGKNPGALYVSDRGTEGTYLGKIVAGRFLQSRDCTSTQAAEVAAMLADPLAAAVAHGKRTGECCMCGLELTNAESIELGIGPICRERWGL